MKKQTKQKKNEQFKEAIKIRYLDEPTKLINKYFPKGSWKRAEALALLAIAFTEGMEAGKEIAENKHKTNLQ